MHEVWRSNGWDGEARVTRVEFRYKRECLKELGVEDPYLLLNQCDPLAAEPAHEVGRLPHPAMGRVTTVGSSVGAIPTPHRERRNSAAPRNEIGYHVLVSSGPNGVPGRTPRSAGLQQSRHGQADERASEASSRWTGLRALSARPKMGMVSERGRC